MNEYTLTVMYNRAEFYRERMREREMSLAEHLEIDAKRFYWWSEAEVEQIKRRSKGIFRVSSTRLTEIEPEFY